MSDVLGRLDRAALSLIRKDFQQCGDRVSVLELAEILFSRLSEDMTTALTTVDVFDGVPGSSVTWTEFLDFLTRNSRDQAQTGLGEEEAIHIEPAANVLMDTTRHGGRIQAVRAKAGEFQVLTAEVGVPGLQVFKKTAEQGVVRVPGERIVPDILLKLPEEFGSSGEYCTDFACTELVFSGTFAGEFVAATLNRRAVVVWEHGGGYKSQLRGVVPLEEGGDRVWWSKKLNVFMISLQVQSGDFRVVMLDPVTMAIIGTLPQDFASRVAAISDVRSIAGAEFVTVVEESGRLTLVGLSREDPRTDMEVTNVVELRRKIMACELVNNQWLLGCLDGAVVVFDPVNSLTVRVMQEHKTSVTCLTVVQNHLVTREDRGDVIVWSLKSFAPVQKLTSINYRISFMVALGGGLLLTASESRLFFMRARLPSGDSSVTSMKSNISSVLFDYRQHRLLCVTPDSVTAVDLSFNTCSSLLRCPGISAAALEASKGSTLAVASKGVVKILNLSSGEIEDEVSLQDPRPVLALTFLMSGLKLGVLHTDGLLALFASGRRIASLVVPAEFTYLAPISVDAVSSRLLLWGASGRSVVVREAARIGKSELSFDRPVSQSTNPSAVLAVSAMCGARLGEADGVVLASYDGVSITRSSGDTSDKQVYLGDKVTHVCHVVASDTAPVAKIAKSIVEKFDEALAFANKKYGKSRAPAALLGPADVQSVSGNLSYIAVGDAGSGRIRVFHEGAEAAFFQDEPGFELLVPIDGLVLTASGERVRLWSIAERQLVFDTTLSSVKLNATAPYNAVKKHLACSLARAVLGRQVEQELPQTEALSSPTSTALGRAETRDFESNTRSFTRSPTKRRASRRTSEVVELPRTPRTLSREFLKTYLLRRSDAEKAKMQTKSHLEEELDIVDEHYQVKKENIVLEQKKKEFKLSTKLAYSVSGSVFRKMEDSMKVSDFISQYSRTLSRQATPKSLSRLSTAPTRAATAKKPSRSSESKINTV